MSASSKNSDERNAVREHGRKILLKAVATLFVAARQAESHDEAQRLHEKALQLWNGHFPAEAYKPVPALQPARKATEEVLAVRDTGNGTKPTAAAAFWAAAERLDPAVPWRAAADKLDLNRAVCQDAHKANTLPPGLTPEAAEAFAST
jgi:hypothetical protein